MKYDVLKDGKIVGETEFSDDLLSLSEFKNGLHNLHNSLFGEYKGYIRFEKNKKGMFLVWSTKGEFLLALKPKPWHRRIL